jgi:hypothetical protein
MGNMSEATLTFLFIIDEMWTMDGIWTEIRQNLEKNMEARES